ncbi:MAG: ribosome-associated translation inhibitor RaiA [Coriobacteriia bacterium]|nr:ribosome-associated translation inhibitor RaiA [Coriobacteriia bacterium]
MKIKVTGRKMTVSDALRSYVEEKIGSSLKVFNITPMNVEVVLRMEKNPANPKPAVAEVTLVTKGHIIRTEEAEEDMYAAIDVAAAKTERQLRKYKTKVIDRRQAGKKLGEVLPSEELVPPLDEHLANLDDDGHIVRVKEIDLEALSEEEALLQIDLLGHDFFVYNDNNTGAVNVIYRRKDGSYGLLKQRLETLEDEL